MLNSMLYYKLTNILRTEAEETMKYQEDQQLKYEKMDNIFNLKKILDNWDELEPTLRKFFMEKARKEKFDREK